MDSVNLTDNFLIAMPTLEDPYFSHALVYICEHNENGALGIIVNRPIDMNLAGLFDKIDIKLDAENLADLPVYFGGPVQLDRGFVLHRAGGTWQSTLAISPEIALTSSRDVLDAVAKVKAKFGYDDSLDVFGIHGVGGIVGAIGTAIVNSEALGGIGYGDLTVGGQLIVQVKAVLLTIVWSGVASFILYKVADMLIGLRVKEEVEREGLDLAEHRLNLRTSRNY